MRLSKGISCICIIFLLFMSGCSSLNKAAVYDVFLLPEVDFVIPLPLAYSPQTKDLPDDYPLSTEEIPDKNFYTFLIDNFADDNRVLTVKKARSVESIQIYYDTPPIIALRAYNTIAGKINKLSVAGNFIYDISVLEAFTSCTSFALSGNYINLEQKQHILNPAISGVQIHYGLQFSIEGFDSDIPDYEFWLGSDCSNIIFNGAPLNSDTLYTVTKNETFTMTYRDKHGNNISCESWFVSELFFPRTVSCRNASRCARSVDINDILTPISPLNNTES